MNNQEFKNKLLHIANNCKTSYKTGGWGQHNGDIWLFDCICLIKGILWGWNEDYSKINGGAVYGSNGVADDTEIGILNRCSNVSSDFSNIEVGEYLYMQGHGGIYIGDRKVVECTVAWDRKVQISDIAIDGTRSKNGSVVKKWEKHGKLPYIEYSQSQPVQPAQAENIYIVQNGDTLGGIANKYNTTYQHLAEINNIADPNKIYVGQEIRIDGSTKVETVNTNKYVLGLYVVNTKSGLNVRTGAGTDNSIKKCYSNGTRFDTYEIKNNWARTPSGWVCLDYCNLVRKY